MEINKSKQYKIKNYLVKNVNLTYDIFIYKPEFLTKNITNVKFSLIDTNGIQSNKLEGYLFDIIIGYSTIYSNNFISNKDVFEYSNIPFEYVVWHQGIFVIYNIPIKLIENILEHHLEITWIETLILQKYPPNTIPPNIFEIKWSLGLEENNEANNSLKIMGGMIGCTYHSTIYDKKFIDSNAKIIYGDTNNIDITDYIGLNIHYIDKEKNWIDGYNNNLKTYSLNKILLMFVEQSRQVQPNFISVPYDMISETFTPFEI
jgi:hypothetical protein